jgi:hypothetical protein
MSQRLTAGFKHNCVSVSLYFISTYLVFHILTTLIITGVSLYENNNR